MDSEPAITTEEERHRVIDLASRHTAHTFRRTRRVIELTAMLVAVVALSAITRATVWQSVGIAFVVFAIGQVVGFACWLDARKTTISHTYSEALKDSLCQVCRDVRAHIATCTEPGCYQCPIKEKAH